MLAYRYRSHSKGRRRVLCLTLAALGAVLCVSCQGTQVTYAPANGSSERVASMLEGYREARIQKDMMVEKELAEKRNAMPSAIDLLAQGDKKRDNGKLAAALFDYLQAFNSNGTDLTPIERVAHLHLRKEPKRAEILFHKLIEQKPREASLLVGMALAQ